MQMIGDLFEDSSTRFAIELQLGFSFENLACISDLKVCECSMTLPTLP